MINDRIQEISDALERMGRKIINEKIELEVGISFLYSFTSIDGRKERLLFFLAEDDSDAYLVNLKTETVTTIPEWEFNYETYFFDYLEEYNVEIISPDGRYNIDAYQEELKK